MKILLALIKREILEHKSIWKVPAILLTIGALIKFSMMSGNLSVNVNTSDFLQLDDTIDRVIDKVVINALSAMNVLVSIVMFIVAVFYSLSCLYNERQDESVLFWRSLPISDGMTIASKFLIALVLVPIAIIVCQLIMSVIFMGSNIGTYLNTYFSYLTTLMMMVLVLVMLPLVSWCLLCSEIAKKNPFLLAFVVPIVVINVDELFFNIGVSNLITDRFSLSHKVDDSLVLLLTGIAFSAVCIFVATFKRSQRI